MRIARRVAELSLDRSKHIGLVPTMGAFHEGHLSLMRKARSECGQVVVSLFVNPTQFVPGEDFDKYPRDEERDAALADAEGVDLLFAPSAEEMYADAHTLIHVREVGDLWEGQFRPGHFDGVATVVCKLFNIVMPSTAYFGLKDLQQCALIRTMVKDLNIQVGLQWCETIREADGLAMSSRNRYLTAAQREVAPSIYRELCRLRDLLRQATSKEVTAPAIDETKARLSDAGILTQYLALVDTQTMSPLEVPRRGASLIVAAHIGEIRLIDNVQLD